jgi:hypothetical protein
LSKLIIQIWPVTEGHRSGFSHEKAVPRLSDLLTAGFLYAGTPLFPRRKKYADQAATILPDGRLDLQGVVYSSPSEAAVSITGKPTNGWWFFLVSQQPRRDLRDVRRDYLESFASDFEEDDADDEAEESDG